MNKTIQYIISTISSILIYLFGGCDSLLISLIIVMVIDYITGVCKGIYNKNVNSSIGLKGILKKIGYLIIVILATLFDNVINDKSMAIRALVIYFFISNEAISILENWGSLGLPLPKKIFEVFEKLKDEQK